MGPHDGHRQRLKTEFLARPDSFPDHKLLELLFFYAIPAATQSPGPRTDRPFWLPAGVLDARRRSCARSRAWGSMGRCCSRQ